MVMTHHVQFGLDTFADVPAGMTNPEAIRAVVEEGVRADQVGVDIFATAVTVLSTDDPVRVYQRFATLDGISNGRAELVLGRGSFTDSFPLFGYDLADYDELFNEKFDLMAKLLPGAPVTWSGTLRSALDNVEVYPKTAEGLRAWVGVGGSPESVVRSVRYRIPMILAIIGGNPMRFEPYVDLYRRAQRELGVTEPMPLGIHSPGHIAESDEEAIAQYWPGFRELRTTIGRERGWPAPRYEDYLAEVKAGSLYVGSPDTVAVKMAKTIRGLGADRFSLVYQAAQPGLGMQNVELYGTEVIPRVRELLAGDAAGAA
ncbi:putative luciferase-like oxidoreductase [Mycobacteroides abscessus subsp. bolletii BD]|nr:putative luciferase-like oxidoreductase [Mycobacteroides abscessus subsp. bolletii BD]